MERVTLTLGERIELRFQLSEGRYSATPFISKIEDILSETEIVIAPPSDNDINRWMQMVVLLTVVREDGAYSVPAKVVSKMYENNLFFLHLNILGEFVRKQRRKFYRLKDTLDVQIEGICKAKTVDISGNGMLIKTDVKLQIRQKIEGTIDLGKDIIPFKGVVVRLQNEDYNDEPNQVSIHFVDIDRNMQEAIIKYIHLKQCYLLQNGLAL